MGLLRVAVGYMTLFCLFLGLFSSFRAALHSLDVKVCAWYHCILLCHVKLMSLGSLLFSGGDRVRSASGERTSGKGPGRSRGSGSCGQEVLNDRIKKNKNSQSKFKVHLINLITV